VKFFNTAKGFGFINRMTARGRVRAYLGRRALASAASEKKVSFDQKRQ
jgi:cold shock CspA family protein